MSNGDKSLVLACCITSRAYPIYGKVIAMKSLFILNIDSNTVTLFGCLEKMKNRRTYMITPDSDTRLYGCLVSIKSTVMNIKMAANTKPAATLFVNIVDVGQQVLI